MKSGDVARHRTAVTAETRSWFPVIVGLKKKKIKNKEYTKQITAGLTYLSQKKKKQNHFYREHDIGNNIICDIVTRKVQFVRDERVLPTDRAFGPNTDTVGTLWGHEPPITAMEGLHARLYTRGLDIRYDIMCHGVFRGYHGYTWLTAAIRSGESVVVIATAVVGDDTIILLHRESWCFTFVDASVSWILLHSQQGTMY